MLIGRTKQTQYMYSEELTTFLSPMPSHPMRELRAAIPSFLQTY